MTCPRPASDWWTRKKPRNSGKESKERQGGPETSAPGDPALGGCRNNVGPPGICSQSVSPGPHPHVPGRRRVASRPRTACAGDGQTAFPASLQPRTQSRRASLATHPRKPHRQPRFRHARRSGRLPERRARATYPPARNREFNHPLRLAQYSIYDVELVWGLFFAAFFGRGPFFRAPAALLWARTVEPSTAENSKSMRSARRPLASSASRIF